MHGVPRAAPTSSTMSTAFSWSFRSRSALAMCPGYHCTMLVAWGRGSAAGRWWAGRGRGEDRRAVRRLRSGRPGLGKRQLCPYRPQQAVGCRMPAAGEAVAVETCTATRCRRRHRGAPRTAAHLDAVLQVARDLLQQLVSLLPRLERHVLQQGLAAPPAGRLGRPLRRGATARRLHMHASAAAVWGRPGRAERHLHTCEHWFAPASCRRTTLMTRNYYSMLARGRGASLDWLGCMGAHASPAGGVAEAIAAPQEPRIASHTQQCRAALQASPRVAPLCANPSARRRCLGSSKRVIRPSRASGAPQVPRAASSYAAARRRTSGRQPDPRAARCGRWGPRSGVVGGVPALAGRW